MPHVPFPKIPQFRDVLVAARKKGRAREFFMKEVAV